MVTLPNYFCMNDFLGTITCEMDFTLNAESYEKAQFRHINIFENHYILGFI